VGAADKGRQGLAALFQNGTDRFELKHRICSRESFQGRFKHRGNTMDHKRQVVRLQAEEHRPLMVGDIRAELPGVSRVLALDVPLFLSSMSCDMSVWGSFVGG
jgi:hypothetical protein